MGNIELIILSLSLAFCWLNINRWLMFKPFNCMMCVTGWFALIIGCIVHGAPQGLLFYPIGCFTGAMFEAIKYRYL